MKKRMDQTTKALRMTTGTLVRGQYVVPYSQEALNGALGLTSSDISRGLGIPVARVHEKIGRPGFEKQARFRKLVIIANAIPNETNGLTDTQYVFDTRSAKAFVQGYQNEVGWAYADFLLDCETAVLENVPKLIRELSDAKSIIKNLTKPKRGKLPSGESCVTLTQIEVRKDMFGTEYFEPLRVKVKMSDMDEAQHAEYKIRHITRIQKGLSKSAEKSLDKAVFVNPTNIMKLKASDKDPIQ
jgi:hypothetical protein